LSLKLVSRLKNADLKSLLEFAQLSMKSEEFILNVITTQQLS